MNHPDRSQIIDNLLGISGKEAKEAEDHVKTCEECRAFADSMSSILRESDNEKLIPSPASEKRILSLLNDLSKKPKSGLLREIILRPALLAASVLIIISAFVTYNFLNTPAGVQEIALSLSPNSGSVYFNNELIETANYSINSGQIKTGAGSSAVVTFDNLFQMKIAENTELTIVSANEIQKNEEKIYNFNFEMTNGTLMADWPDHSVKKTFTVKTKYAFFEALGTGFILSETKNLSKLAVLKGSVRASLINNKEEQLILNAGEGCTGSETLVKINIIPENEARQFNNLFNNALEKGPKPQTISESRDNSTKENDTDSGENTNKKDNENTAGRIRDERSELLKEGRKIQKEMQKNIRSGNRSRE